MKAKKLFPDLSFKRLWDKIKDLEDKIEQSNTGSDSGITTPQYKEQSGIVSQFTTTPGDGADDMYIDFPEVFDTVPTDFVCVDVEQSNMFTFTVKELTRSYAIVTVKSSLSYNSINDFSWKAVAYSDDQNKNLKKVKFGTVKTLPNGYMDVVFDTSDFAFEKTPMLFVTPVGISEVNNVVVAKIGAVTKDGFRLACNYHSTSSLGFVDVNVNYMAVEI